MTLSSRRPPFPVADAADLRRAVRWVQRNDDDPEARRYVTTRARSLGHIDLLPADWQVPKPRSSGSAGLDEQFEQQAARYGISVTKLKTVYFRGVREFQESDMTLGSAAMWGLGRVQRFINAVSSGATPAVDADLVAVTESVPADPGVEVSLEAGTLLTDVLYTSGENVAEMFHPGTVTSMQVEDQLFTVEGELDGHSWVYSLDTVTGAHSFRVM